MATTLICNHLIFFMECACNWELGGYCGTKRYCWVRYWGILARWYYRVMGVLGGTAG